MANAEGSVLEKPKRTAAAYVEICAQALPIHVVADPRVHVSIIVRFRLTLNCCMRRHGERDNDIDLVGLHLFGNAPATLRLDCDRTTDREADPWVRID